MEFVGGIAVGTLGVLALYLILEAIDRVVYPSKEMD